MIPLFFTLLLVQSNKIVIEGTVFNAQSKEPLRKATVTLECGKTSYAVTSDGEGKFHFEGIEPEICDLQVERQGFIDGDAPTFEVEPGEQIKDLRIAMTPQGIIDGHVVDEDGDPVPGLRIEAARIVHVNGKTITLDHAGAISNNEGYFLVSELPAGRYYLSAEPLSWHGGRIAQPGHRGPEEEFVHTEDSVPHDVAAGGALRGVVLHVRKSVVYRIRGRVINPGNGQVGVRLVPPDRVFRGNDPQATVRNGTFEFASVPAGNYLLALLSDGLYRNIPVSVTDHDVDGIVAELAPGPGISGTVKMEDGTPFAKPQSLQPVPFTSAAPEIRAKEDGSFGWTNLEPRKYFIAYGPPEGDYIKSIQVNHQPSTDLRVDVTDGASATIDIVVAPNAAGVSIKVDGAKATTFVCWNDSYFASFVADPDGGQSFEHLAPGEYRILAFEKVEEAMVESPAFRSFFDAAKITLTEGSHETVEVKAIPKSVSDAEIAKLQ